MVIIYGLMILFYIVFIYVIVLWLNYSIVTFLFVKFVGCDSIVVVLFVECMYFR